MNFLETLFQPNENQKQIFEYVESSYFPWFFQEIIRNGSEEGKDSLYAHTLRLRHSDESLPVTGKSNSGVMQAMEDIFFEIAKSNKVEVDTVLRSAVNATHHSKQSMWLWLALLQTAKTHTSLCIQYLIIHIYPIII